MLVPGTNPKGDGSASARKPPVIAAGTLDLGARVDPAGASDPARAASPGSRGGPGSPGGLGATPPAEAPKRHTSSRAPGSATPAPRQVSLLEREGGAGEPLAARMRPRTLDELVGQEHVAGPGTALRAAVERGRLPSLILWGPPGSGKTTLAQLLAAASGARFTAVSAVTAGVADLRRVVQEASRVRQSSGQGASTVLFVDELHRWNRSQQDAILPHVETGLLTLVGATTENPSFAVNAALLSRCRVLRLNPLAEEQLGIIVDRALADATRGLGGRGLSLEADARRYLLGMAGGDARAALMTLELAAERGPRITLAVVEDALQRRALLYDRAGEQHYHLASALIKSVRGSDPDAAVYWLARMLEAGEDPQFVARRLVILAAEDVGLADPAALGVAVAAQQAAHFVGMPEAVLPLTEAAIYLATAPKSNAGLKAYRAAQEDVARYGALPVPLHMRNAVTALDRAMGYGAGYRYAHDADTGVIAQTHLPADIEDRRYYEPTPRGYEGRVGRGPAAALRPEEDRAASGHEGSGDAGPAPTAET